MNTSKNNDSPENWHLKHDFCQTKDSVQNELQKRKKDKVSKRANINGQLKQKISSHTFPTIKSRKSTFH